MIDPMESAAKPVHKKLDSVEGDRAGCPPEEPMLYCPVCSAKLIPRRCKLLCERCGYYMSCADYY